MEFSHILDIFVQIFRRNYNIFKRE